MTISSRYPGSLRDQFCKSSFLQSRVAPRLVGATNQAYILGRPFVHSNYALLQQRADEPCNCAAHIWSYFSWVQVSWSGVETPGADDAIAAVFVGMNLTLSVPLRYKARPGLPLELSSAGC